MRARQTISLFSPRIVAVCLACAVLFGSAGAGARKQPAKDPASYHFTSTPEPADLPPDIAGVARVRELASAAADTFHLAWFDFGTAAADPQGWVGVDLTVPFGALFHVASGSNELNGGTFGNLLPLEGDQSVWCGVPASAAEPFCGYATLPGYGNAWLQYFTFCYEHPQVIATAWLHYMIFWDSEPAYDFTYVQVRDSGGNWVDQPVNGGIGWYDGIGSLTEWITNIQINYEWLYWRFRFASDGAWSDEDGLWPTDGAVIVDAIETSFVDAGGDTTTFYHDFEAEADGATQTLDGLWVGNVPEGFGDFAALYPGVTVFQSDPCLSVSDFLWGFFDDPAITNYACHLPNPLPTQGAVRFGPSAEGFYLRNEIYSPRIPYVGSGDDVRYSFLVYRDLPLDNLIFYLWHVRSWAANCPGQWRDIAFVYYGGGKDWLRSSFPVGQLIEPGATEIQLALAAWDMCQFWCLIFGTGSCHSHAPLFDEVHLVRINHIGPQWNNRHIDFFQDNFAQDGTTTGHARADAAGDIAPRNSATIRPGDSVRVNVAPVGGDPLSGLGPAVYAYVSVWPPGQLGKTGGDIEAPETRAGVGKRWPLVNTTVDNGITWHCYRMDSTITSGGARLTDRYCIDLNDSVFTPGDTICYFFGARDGLSNVSYFSRKLNGQGDNFTTESFAAAAASPMEFTILPAGGWKRGGDVLYVDDTDDRGGPAQLFFDTAFDVLGIRHLVDRYDVLGPSSAAGNSLASRVKNTTVQIQDCYRNIIWSSGNLSSGTIGDGTGNPEKSNDFGLLFQYLDTSPNVPGLYISGDDVAQEWSFSAGTGAINLRSLFMSFNVMDGSHISAGNSVSPCLAAVGPCFIHSGVPDSLVVFGGCPLINDFDVLEPTGPALAEFVYPAGGAAVISQATPNSAGSTARVILSGFSYDYIRTKHPGFPVARVEHLRDILIWLQTLVPFPTGADPAPAFVSYLGDNFPNPFNPATTIRFGIDAPAHVTLRVYDVAGRLVRTLVNGPRTPAAGGFEAVWDGRNEAGEPVASGVYFYHLTAGRFSGTQKMVLLK